MQLWEEMQKIIVLPEKQDSFLSSEPNCIKDDCQKITQLEREKVNLEVSLKKYKDDLEQAIMDLDNLRLQNHQLEAKLVEQETVLEESTLHYFSQSLENDYLQGMLIDWKAGFESMKLDLVKEKDELEHRLLLDMQLLEEVQRNAAVLEGKNLAFLGELNSMKQDLKQGEMEKANFEVALEKCTDDLEKANSEVSSLRPQNDQLQCMLTDREHAVEEARLNTLNLRSENEQLEGIIIDCKTDFESAKLTLVKEKNEQEEKIFCSMQLLQETQQRVAVLEERNLLLLRESNHIKRDYEKTKEKILALKKEKAEIELNFANCKQMLNESQSKALMLDQERENLAKECVELKKKCNHGEFQYSLLTKAKKVIEDSIADYMYAFDKTIERHFIVEQGDSEDVSKQLSTGFGERDQLVPMLETDNNKFETVLSAFQKILRGTQKHAIHLVEENNYLGNELNKTRKLLEAEKHHTLLLEEEKSAMQSRVSQYKEIADKREQHVSTQQRALEGTLQRADALDHQVQLFRMKIERLNGENGNLLSSKHEQEAYCKNLEAQRKILHAELESMMTKQKALEETLAYVNSLYSSVMEDTKKDKHELQLLQHRQSVLEEENNNLRLTLENTKRLRESLEAEQQKLLKDVEETDSRLEKVLQEWNAMSAEHEKQIAALITENATKGYQIDELMGQIKQSNMDLESLSQIEINLAKLSKKFNEQRSELNNTKIKLEFLKFELARKQVELEHERSVKEKVVQELNAKVITLSLNVQKSKEEERGTSYSDFKEDIQDTRCGGSEYAPYTARSEPKEREQEVTLVSRATQGLNNRQNHCLELEHRDMMLLAKAQARESQSCVEGIESRLIDAGHFRKDESKVAKNPNAQFTMSYKGKGEDNELSGFPEERETFEPRIIKQDHESTDMAWKAEEIERLREKADMFQQALFYARETAVTDAAGLLFELKSLKHLLIEITRVDKKRGG
ncbi:hypothetical protein KP509_22G055000 [Ceratopteris richardii]|nr:hypothetical protein KP509_22G055000 [Ceratopteris richardii]